MPKRDFYVKEEELDDYQVKIINKRTDSSFIVKGCAGSGKSILALWKAKQIQENGSSFLFVIFGSWREDVVNFLCENSSIQEESMYELH